MKHLVHEEVKSGSQKMSFLEIFLPVFYILAQYSLPYFSIGFWVLAAYACVLVLVKRTFYIQKWLFLMLIYVLMNQLLVHGTSTEVNSIIGIIISVLLVFILSGEINEDNLYKVYSFVGVITMIAVVIQSFSIFVLHANVGPIVLFPSLIREDFWYFLGERPTSFFSEPQAYASYIIPLLFLAMKRRRMLFAILITLTIFLSTSSQGIVISLALWTFYAIKYLKNAGSRMVAIVILGCFIVLLCNLPVFDFAVNKIANTNFAQDPRISKGFVTYSALPITEQWMGIGYRNLTNYAFTSDISFYWMETQPESGWEYVTTVSGMFLYFGVLGGCLLLLLFYKMIRYDDKSNFLFLIVIIISSMAQTLMFNQWFLFYYVLYFSISRKKAENFWIVVFTYNK